MSNYISDNEQRFREWLRRQLTRDGIRRYSDNAIIAYAHALRTACMKITPYVANNLFSITNSDEYEKILEKIIYADNFEIVNEESGNGTFITALKLYQHLLKYGVQSTAPNLSAAFYITENGEDTRYDEDRGLKYHYEEIAMTPIQKIYYGAPGTGKSYSVGKLIESEYPEKEAYDEHCRRLIFHPTYTYEELVGDVKPYLSQDKPVEYMFVPGPLTSILKDAFSNPKEKYYLVIEEINRGNAPAIFGDLFQLLDRSEAGKSRYPVQNHLISSYLSRDPGLKHIFVDSKIWFPSNLNILATMNTADENIFILDSAFKRRFALDYVRIDFDKLPEDWTKPYDTFAGRKPLTTLFQGSSLAPMVSNLYLENKLNRDWATFATLANELIDITNMDVKKSANPQLARIAENKKLGPFFVSVSDLKERENFINKVIFYLKQDVFPYSDRYMTESYEDIFMKYLKPDSDIFELLT